MNLLESLRKRSKLIWIILGMLLIGVVGVLDYLTGNEYSFSLFYLFPIGVMVWFTGRTAGLIAAGISALVWVAADILAGSSYSSPAVYIWNTIIRLGFFLVVAYLLALVRSSLNRERGLASIDGLTGAVNSRSFQKVLQNEIDRSQRNHFSFTLAYIDLDNFKMINDFSGHSAGDQVLCAIVDKAKKIMRKVDVIARLGGDEFALLLPETDDAAAKQVVKRIHAGMQEEMDRNGWAVTFSIGVLTCTGKSCTPDLAIRTADDLMYEAKKNGKNSIQFYSHLD